MKHELITCDRKFNGSKHFLCLMGTIKAQRICYLNFYNNQNISSKGIVSARWVGISTERIKQQTPTFSMLMSD